MKVTYGFDRSFLFHTFLVCGICVCGALFAATLAVLEIYVTQKWEIGPVVFGVSVVCAGCALLMLTTEPDAPQKFEAKMDEVELV